MMDDTTRLLKRLDTALKQAKEAYQFHPGSYSYQMIQALAEAHDRIREQALDWGCPPGQPDLDEAA